MLIKHSYVRKLDQVLLPAYKLQVFGCVVTEKRNLMHFNFMMHKATGFYQKFNTAWLHY